MTEAPDSRFRFTDRPVWRERLGVYLLGVAIGLVLVGTLLWGRYQAAKRERSRAEAAQKQAESGAGTGTNSSPTDRP